MFTEELLAYAYLLENGFDIESLYENKLYELYISAPNDSNFFELEIISGDIINASLIRKMLTNGNDVSKYVPRATLKYLNDIPSKDKYYSFLNLLFLLSNQIAYS